MNERGIVGLRVLALVLVAGFGVLVAAVRARPDRSLPGDDAVAAWLTRFRTPGLTDVANRITQLGSPGVLLGLAVLAAALLWWRGFDGRRLVIVLGAWLGTAGAVTVLKVVVGRERPPVEALSGPPAWDLAFPSGHTTDSAVIYLLLALSAGQAARPVLARAWTVAAAVLAVLIAISRIYLGYHWFTDVIGGWLFSGAVLCVATGELLRSGPRPCWGPSRPPLPGRPVRGGAPARSDPCG